MQFEPRRPLRHIPNLTPLIDIVFLLLVFFMLTSHFVQEQSIPIELPQSQSGDEVSDSKPLELVLDRLEHIYIGEHLIPPNELDSRLHEELSGRQDKVIRIRGDRVVTLGTTITILDSARKAGAQGIELVTQEQTD